MKFRTSISPLNSQGLISHTSKIMMLGSCFSDNVGGHMRRQLFDVKINPFGTLYNPESIAMAVDKFIDGHPIDESALFNNNGLWNSFLCHSSLSSYDSHIALNSINTQIQTAHNFLSTADIVVITLGTAWVYRLAESGVIVANCHKLPSKMFTHIRLSVEEATDTLCSMVQKLLSYNPNINLIFTVSPIRHLADEAHGNQLSKSTLILAIEKVCNIFGNKSQYFPAYEIMMDDLRDYRFYTSDLCHPTEMAVEYIYDLFSQSYFATETRNTASECESYTRRLNHRHLTDDQNAIDKFNTETKNIRNKLIEHYPYLTHRI